jgi:uncharacterized protein
MRKNNKLKFLFFLGHPAHFHLYKNVINDLLQKKHIVYTVIKSKDILEELLESSGIEYSNFCYKNRKNTILGMINAIVIRDFKLARFCLKYKPNVMIGSSVEISHIGKLLNIPSIVIGEDDYDAIPLFARITYPFATTIVTPISCPTGRKGSKWEKKTIHYKGFNELAYLHPDLFKPDIDVIKRYSIKKPFVIIRFAELVAYHDEGKKGITNKIAKQIIRKLSSNYQILITSERKLESEFDKYKISIDIQDIHHVLFFADLYVGDSQTMAAEAAILGTPSIRFNDFVGRLGYLEELEHKYKLTCGVKTSDSKRLFEVIDEYCRISDLKAIFSERRLRMLNEKINVSSFLCWFIENYPTSKEMMKNNPNIQDRFK